MKKILVIEDCAETRNLLLKCLEAQGFYTIGALNGLMGVERVIEVLPDLIICDILIPELDGYGVLRAVRTDPRSMITPFIFLTGLWSRADFRKAMETGADDYLTKPFTVEELLAAVTTQLEKQAAKMRWYAAQFRLLGTVSEPNPESIFPSDPTLTDVFQFIEVNYCQSIGLHEVAQALGYSPSYLTGLVRQKTGQTINHWIIKRRMAAAQVLLMKSNLPMNQIASSIGYQNVSHFFRQFRQYYGTTPQTWRNEYFSLVTSN